MPRKKRTSPATKTRKTNGRNSASKASNWDVDYLTTSPESALVHADLVVSPWLLKAYKSAHPP